MNKTRKLLITIISTVVCFISSFNQKTTITIAAKEYKNGTGISDVSTRDLAMLASLVYEDVPNDNIYKNSPKKQGCITKNGSLIKNCFYKAYDDEFVELKNKSGRSLTKNDQVLQYVEGMSKRKMMSIVSAATSSFQEDGEKYYFLNFAKTKELEKEGWTIFDYGTAQTESGSTIEKILEVDNINFKGVFDAVTFKKGDNYVIAYRGTDYPDLLEWIQDVGYAFEGEHAEAAMAYKYASDVYDAIPKNANTKIYVTGHSLGAYLAQVGGAAIINKEAGIDVNATTSKAYQTYDEYKSDYYKKNSYLEQVAYFNGMGVGGVFLSNDFIKQVQNALVYLSTYSKDGQLATSGRNLNYTNSIKSSGRLVSYEMDGDPISAIGLHYGEIYKLETGADAITNHRGNHENAIGEALPEVFGGLTSVLNELDKVSVSLTTSEAIRLLKMSLSSNLEQSPENGNIPTSIVNQLKNEYNVDINRFNLGSLVDNLNADLDAFSSRYGITNLFDHFNANHETDSFACVKDANNGYINDIKLEVSSTGFNCEGTTCYTNKGYNDRDFVFNEKVITKNYQGNNIMLSAKIEGACAKQYTWYASSDGINWTNLGTTIDNKIIIPRSIFGAIPEEGTQEYYFKVAALYGDSFTELKSTFSADSTIIKYQRATAYQTNPTINDGVTSTGKTTVESSSTKVSLVIDRTKPTCTLPKSPQNIELSCLVGGSFCTEKTKNISIVCTDPTSNGSSSNFNDSSAKLTINTKDTGLIDSIELLRDKFKTTCSGNKLTHKIAVQVNRVPSYKVPKVVIKGDVTDRAGNKVSINSKVEYKITNKK